MEQLPQTQSNETPKQHSGRFGKIKDYIYVSLTVLSMVWLYEIKQEQKSNKDYQVATQNVTNRYIGMLEGAGQVQCSQTFLKYVQDVEKERKLKQGDF